MYEYFDIHNHVLPGLDDGARNLDESKEILHLAYNEGIRHIIATPHYREDMFISTKEKINTAFEQVNRLIADEGLDITLYLGNEIFFSHDVNTSLLNNELFTMADSDYVLLEFSPNTPYQYIVSGLQTLIMSGYWPIMAHFERYNNVISDMNNIDEIYNMGVCIQVNASTITGSIRNKPTRIARKLLKYDMIDFVATDSHNVNSRAPKLAECAEYLKKKYGQDLCDKLLYINPKKLINNEDIK